MPHMQEMFGQMNMGPPHGAPQPMGGSPLNMTPIIHNVDMSLNVSKVSTIYEAFLFTKADEGPGQVSGWSRAVRTPVLASQEALANKARKMANSKTTVKDVLAGRDMEGCKRRQILELIDDKNIKELDQRYEWKPAYIELKKRRRAAKKAGVWEIETVSMDVIVKRIPKIVQYTNGARLSQPLGAEIVDVNGFGHGQGHHGMGAMYPRPVSSYGGSQGPPMIEIAPGPRHFDAHGPPHSGHGFHGPPPPPPPPHIGGPGHGGPAMVEVLHDHHDAHGQHPMGPSMPKPGKQYHGGHEYVGGHDDHHGGHDHHGGYDDHHGGQDDHHGGYSGHSSPMKKNKKNLRKIDIHNSRPKGKVEKWNRQTSDSSSSSYSEDDFSDNATVLTPNSSISGHELKYERPRRSSRRDSHDSHNYKIIQPRQHRRGSPHHRPGHRRSSTYEDEGFVVLQAAKAVREAAVATAALQSSIPARTTERPPLSGHAYTYDDRISHDYEARRMSGLGGTLTRRASEVRRGPNYRERFEIARDLKEQEWRDRERDLELRDRELRQREFLDRDRLDRDRLDRDRLREQELADLRRHEIQDRAGYGGRSGVRYGPLGY